ncbi:9968_t:CDS:2 [Ambispora gerdemannii]|uniref:9968_t:CDS:1 n=1 Tax=Ambispora gerdemannii TaxID=144530 RepID=A0A9N8VSY2_9GLOM|nr:9968_t:CDS:2 [Ambispora gerdemannii]
MKLSIVFSPVVLLLAPFILVVMASFTTVAVVTSALAIIVLWVRLGFLIAEFSGGVVMDIASWGMRKWVKVEDETKVKVSKIKVVDKKRNSKDYSSYHQQKQHSYLKKQQQQQRKQKGMYPIATTKVNKLSVDFDEKTLLKERDNYELHNGEFYTKRPQGRRAKSLANSKEGVIALDPGMRTLDLSGQAMEWAKVISAKFIGFAMRPGEEDCHRALPISSATSAEKVSFLISK